MPRKANLYTFSLQNSLRYIDPDGREPGTSGISTEYAAWFNEPISSADLQRHGEMLATVGASIVADAVLGVVSDGIQAADSASNGDWRGFGIAMAAMVVPGVSAGALKAARSTNPGTRINLLPKTDSVTPPDIKIKAKDRRAAQQASSKEQKHGDPNYKEPASEAYAKHKASELEKSRGKDARRESHDKKDAGEGDRSKDQIDDDYAE